VSALLPDRPPFSLRARILSPLADGGTLWQPDGIVIVDAGGALAHVGAFDAAAHADAIDIRPLVVLPGMVDTHVHLPQVPNAGLGAGLDLLAWLERYIFPLEGDFDGEVAAELVPKIYRAMAAAGTTTFVGYGAIWADSLDACFVAAEEHGIRATIGKVMMDRTTYDDQLPRDRILETSLRQSADLCERWDGAADGRLHYAFTPRFAVSCSEDMLRESAALAAHYGVTWQTHLSEDAREMATVKEHFPEAIDYLDVYDRAGGVTQDALFAHSIHLSDREVDRLADSGAAVSHCPVSNMFISSGVMPLARYQAAGIPVGLGSDVAGAPELSIITQMREGFYQHCSRRTLDPDHPQAPSSLEWLRLGTLGGAEAMHLDDIIGSVEAGKEADLILVDPELGAPPGAQPATEATDVADRLIFRERHGMVRAAWVRGQRLDMEEPTNA
jgi:guanine deaminase